MEGDAVIIVDYDFPIPGDGREVLIGTDPDNGTLVYADYAYGVFSARCERGALTVGACARTLTEAIGRAIAGRNAHDPRYDTGRMSLADVLDALGVGLPDA